MAAVATAGAPPRAKRARSAGAVTYPSPRTSSRWADDQKLPAHILRRLANGQAVVARGGNMSRGYLFAKRALDIAGATVLLTLLSPILMVTTVVLVVTTRGRPFFRQRRLGQGGRTFSMWKFRSMVVGADARLHLVPNEAQGPIFKNRRDPRITRIGAILRKTSVDELPQLFNVLLGHMSLVGPRPPVAREVAEYEPWQLRRLAVKPGLTCLWQVSGRSEVGFEDWVRMDLWYVDNQSLLTDIELLLATPRSVLSCRGAF